MWRKQSNLFHSGQMYFHIVIQSRCHVQMPCRQRRESSLQDDDEQIDEGEGGSDDLKGASDESTGTGNGFAATMQEIHKRQKAPKETGAYEILRDENKGLLVNDVKVSCSDLQW